MKAPAPLRKLTSPIAIAVSGGGDSMALLLLAHEAGLAITALTVDHALRPGSAAEARWVKRWCKERGIAHVTLKWKHAPIATGLQAKARVARYDLMTRWCARHGVTTLLTAHTRNDQAETVAMRQRRTMSARSLAAIWPEATWNGIRILRPLLGKSRTQLRAHLAACGQPWLEDPSNSNEKFERVRIRLQGAPEHLAALAATAQRQVNTAKAEARAWLRQNVRLSPFGMQAFAPASLAGLTALARDEALQILITRAGGKAPDRAARAALMAWMGASGAPRRSLGGALFARRKSEILVAREPGRIAATPEALDPKRPTLWDSRFLVTGPRGSTVTSKSKHKTLKRNMNIPAFVDQGLPVVSLAGVAIADPFFASHPLAKITFAAN